MLTENCFERVIKLIKSTSSSLGSCYSRVPIYTLNTIELAFANLKVYKMVIEATGDVTER